MKPNRELYSKMAKRMSPAYVMEEFLSDLVDAQIQVEEAIKTTRKILWRLTGKTAYRANRRAQRNGK